MANSDNPAPLTGDAAAWKQQEMGLASPTDGTSSWADDAIIQSAVAGDVYVLTQGNDSFASASGDDAFIATDFGVIGEDYEALEVLTLRSETPLYLTRQDIVVYDSNLLPFM